eukprot:6874871-Pyramimonas_sp.AAC.1
MWEGGRHGLARGVGAQKVQKRGAGNTPRPAPSEARDRDPSYAVQVGGAAGLQARSAGGGANYERT